VHDYQIRMREPIPFNPYLSKTSAQRGRAAQPTHHPVMRRSQLACQPTPVWLAIFNLEPRSPADAVIGLQDRPPMPTGIAGTVE
jgi:hypothetical protein